MTLWTDGIRSTVAKLTIEESPGVERDVYLTTGYQRDGALVHVEIKLGNVSRAQAQRVRCPQCGTQFENARANDLALALDVAIRCQLEVICAQATDLLSAGLWTCDQLAQAWRGTRFYPAGVCLQIPAIDMDTGREIPGSHQVVTGPLDACAIYVQRKVCAQPDLVRKRTLLWGSILQKVQSWVVTMSDEEIDRILAECLEIMEENPDALTAWERAFLDDLDAYLYANVLTERQEDKLLEIHESIVRKIGGEREEP